jgi:hypothetical protein
VVENVLGVPVFGGTNPSLALLHKNHFREAFSKEARSSVPFLRPATDRHIGVFSVGWWRSDHPPQVTTYSFQATKGDR